TGFPGFIGERLIPRVLDLQPTSRIACLVQPRFLDTARKSVAELEARHPAVGGRLDLLAGDITEPALGLSEGHVRALRGSLRSAYHLAAVYDLAVGRDLARRVNVEGTRNVLAFLGDVRAFERLHYVSTCYVSGTATGVFRETDLDVGQSFRNHYEETKFLAEVDVVKSGVPATVYRPSIVMGDSRTGETGKFDGPYFILTAMERVPSPGLFLRVGSGRNPANLVPVDFIVESLARLSSDARSADKTYHLADPEPLSAFEVGKLFARALGKRFTYVPAPLALARAAFAPRAVQSLFGMPRETLDYFDHPCRYDTTIATADLAALGIRCPRFSDYAPRLVEFYRANKGKVRRAAMV
ncbi:MAG TPA: SDR family oxidoreductase, partial [Vicinamibacteria bacterium]|nr:SDR family oxidoreductase [Vicinamibacteria bacterium]